MDSELIRDTAIQNRLKFGKAKADNVLGHILSERPELKKNIREVMAEIKDVVDEVNKLSDEELGAYALRDTTSEGKQELKLPGNPKNVVMRFAPNPNGPPTLGHSRGIVINSELVKRYGGKLILRFDDTDPKTKKPMVEAYDWYVQDCIWLDMKPDEVVVASERIPKYYEYAEKLIELGKAYVCFCSQNEFKKLKDAGRPCPHRNTKPPENQKNWADMLSGKYGEGDVVLRIKTDLKNPDPALRDWVAFRILKEDHPRVGRKYVVWPMLDFEGAIEDRLLGVTHILRGKDLMDSEKRQKYVYQYFGWTYPEVLHWGKIKVIEDTTKFVPISQQDNSTPTPSGSTDMESRFVPIPEQDNSASTLSEPADATRPVLISEQDNSAPISSEPADLEDVIHEVVITKLSTSSVAEAIRRGEYTDWNDLRLYMIRALRRRGITREAIRNVMLDLGLSEHDISLSMETLYAENRKILDPVVNRYFFVDNPVKLVLDGIPPKTMRMPLHPNFPKRGFREYPLRFDGTKTTVYISGADAASIKKGDTIKLIGLPSVEIKEKNRILYGTYTIARKPRELKKIHWVQDHVEAEVLMNDRPPTKPVKGFCETACSQTSVGETVQFERFGFVRLEEKDDKLIFCFGHK